jgi:hypothetical protein
MSAMVCCCLSGLQGKGIGKLHASTTRNILRHSGTAAQNSSVTQTARFFAAVTVLTLGPDKQIANAVRAPTPAITALLEVITARPAKYGSALRKPSQSSVPWPISDGRHEATPGAVPWSAITASAIR